MAMRELDGRGLGSHEFKRRPLLGPIGGHVHHQAFEAKAAREAPVNGGFDEKWIEKGPEEGLPDRAFGSAFARGDRRDGEVSISDKTIEPSASPSIGCRKGPLRLDAHGTKVS